MSEARNNAMEEVVPASATVRVCRICGSPNPQNDSSYCINCWLRLDRPDLLPKEEAVSRFAQRRRWWLRNKPLILAAVVVLGLVIWQAFVAWDVRYLVTPSPSPVSSVSADAGPGNWGTGRRKSPEFVVRSGGSAGSGHACLDLRSTRGPVPTGASQVDITPR